MGKFDMDPDYNEVKFRILEFRAKYPEGSLQPADLSKPYTIETIAGETYIVVTAAAYRTPDDIRPGIGMAYEVFPGKTPYTKGSELMNAETSAWGRAIVAVGAADTSKSVASATEVRNRQAERTPSAPDPLTEIRGRLSEIGRRKEIVLADEFHTWSEGKAIAAADVATLTQFANSLEPETTTRVRRAS